KTEQSLDAIAAEAAVLLQQLRVERTAAPLAESSKADKSKSNDMDCCTLDANDLVQLRREYLQKQVSALAARVRMLKGEKLKFDDESRALYDAVAPTYHQSGPPVGRTRPVASSGPDSHFADIIAELEKKIPSTNRQSGPPVGQTRPVASSDPLWQRYEEWRKPFMIPKE